MSVPVWKRKLSSAQFIYEVYTLNIRLGEILENKPQKYKANYADDIIKTALEALEHLQIADSIYLTKYSSVKDYEIRREHLLVARGQIEHVATASFIFLEIVKRHHHASEGKPKKRRKSVNIELTPEEVAAMTDEAEERRRKQEAEYKKKIADQEIEIGESCETAYNLISGLLDADKELYKQYIKPKEL